MREKLLYQARVISKKLGDQKAFWFHYKAVKILGFQKCYELASYSLLLQREGRIKTTIARFYNGCVCSEIRNIEHPREKIISSGRI